jgi:hypothetical protein
VDAGFVPDGTRIVSVSHDGTTRVWSALDGRPLGRLLSFFDGTWAVVDEDGRYDASRGGDVWGLHWVIGDEPVSLDQLKQRYYEPGLLRKVMGFDPQPRRTVRGFAAPRLFPSVRLDPPTDGSPLKIHLQDRGGGIGRVVVKVNGKEVRADARGDDVAPGATEVTLSVDLAGDPRLKPGEENEIEVQAYNGEGYLRSRGLRVSYTAPGVRGSAAKLWAVVAGVADYTGDKIDLRFAAKDAADFAKGLETGAKALFGVERVHFALLQDATRAELVHALRAARRAKPNDILVLYLAGHGVNYGGQDGDFYFLTRGARSADLADPAVRAATSLSSDELTELVKRIPALKQVLILDTCASGKLVEKLTTSRDVPASQVRALDRLKDRTGLHVLAGCTADRVSYEATQYGQGLLTYSLLLGMRGAALRNERYVDVSTLFEFAADRVPVLAGEVGGIQRPVIASPQGGASFDIGLLSDEAKAEVPLRAVRPLVLRSNFQDEAAFEDVLKLGRQVDGALVRASDSDDAPLVFVDVREFPGAYRLAGRYQREKGRTRVWVRLSRKDSELARFTVEGKDPAEIADRIVAEAAKQLR